jgi:hypothetical protein
MAKPQDPANSVVIKAVAIRWDERRIIFLEFRRATTVADVKSFAGKDRQDARKKHPEHIGDRCNLADIFRKPILRRPLNGAPRAALGDISLISRGRLGPLVLELSFLTVCVRIGLPVPCDGRKT